jgi:hypothetical protein
MAQSRASESAPKRECEKELTMGQSRERKMDEWREGEWERRSEQSSVGRSEWPE